MKDSLLSETLDYYRKIDSIYKSTEYRKSYELNTFWSRENMRNMLKILHNSSSSIEAIHSVQKTWMFSVNTSEPVKAKAVDWLLDNQRKRGIDIFRMDTSIEESIFSNPENNVLRKGRILTPDFLRTVNIVHEIKKYCRIGKSRFRIIELGAGCGHLARTIRLFVPNCSYVIIDIPEALCFSYIFLKLGFPEAKTLYVTDEKQLENSSANEFDYIFIPTKFAEGILSNSFDIFINTASLGEMVNSVIRYWMDFVQKKLGTKYIFTLNRYLNTIKTDGSMDWRLDENECSVLYDATLKILHWELELSYTRCPYIDTIIARYLEIVAQKVPADLPEERKKKAQHLLSEVADEDWIRLENTFKPAMTCRDNILVNDMSMNGTLFKLWESIRLYPDEVNVAWMLKYLETLNRRQDVEFEETYYYENLFEKLFVSKANKKLCKIYETIKGKRRYAKSFPELKPSFSQEVFDLPRMPELIYEGYKGFNIIRYKNRFYALAKSLGSVDLITSEEDKLAEYQNSGKCVIKDSFKEVKLAVEELVCKHAQDELGEVEAKIGILQNEINNSSKQITVLTEGLENAQKKSIALVEEIDRLKDRLEKNREESVAREEAVNALKGELTKAHKESAARAEELASLRSELEKTQKESAARAEELAELKTELSRAQKEFAAHTKKHIDLGVDLERAQEKAASYSEQIATLTADLEKAQNESAIRTGELVCLRSELEKTKVEYESTRNVLEKELRIYRAKYRAMTEDLRIQSGYLQEQQKLLSDIRSGSIFDLTLRKLKRSIARNLQ